MKITYNEKIQAQIEESNAKVAKASKTDAAKRPEKKLNCEKISSSTKQRGHLNRDLSL